MQKNFLVKVGPLSVGYPLPREVDPSVGGGVHGALPVVLLDQDPDVDLVAGAQALQGAQGRGGQQVVVLACVGWVGSKKKERKERGKKETAGTVQKNARKRTEPNNSHAFLSFSKGIISLNRGFLFSVQTQLAGRLSYYYFKELLLQTLTKLTGIKTVL